MNAPLPKYASDENAAHLLSALGQEFAVVENPQYVFPPYDLYPFTERQEELRAGLRGAVMDMDGTTTTTEPLCIHSLETMVRRVTNRHDSADWGGLDHERDYPHIIGNSTTKHVEYLLRTYKDALDIVALRRAYILAAAWTLGQGADEGRQREVRSNCVALGVGGLLEDSDFLTLMNEPTAEQCIDTLFARHGDQFQLANMPAIVRASVDIYYQRYHEILAQIDAGRGDAVAQEVFGQTGGHLIEPMPGIGVFLACIKGWLGNDAAGCAPVLLEDLRKTGQDHGMDEAEATACMAQLGQHFEQHPARVAIVTSSIEYEARIVLREVFRVLQGQVSEWGLPEKKQAALRDCFADPLSFYEGFITASDSSEIRLKPHRDLYSLALHRIGLLPEEFHTVAGFEDSESGAIAIRAAGISVCCALPFAMTQGHSFQAATHTCIGGIPEVLLRHHIFLPENLLP
jgi:beta-phosphoglucomutase-like phosphatase (HAD superfamily)